MIKDFETVPVKFKFLKLDDVYYTAMLYCLVHTDIACAFQIATHYVVINYTTQKGACCKMKMPYYTEGE